MYSAAKIDHFCFFTSNHNCFFVKTDSTNIGYIAAVFFLYISYITWLKCVMENKFAMLKTAAFNGMDGMEVVNICCVYGFNL